MKSVRAIAFVVTFAPLAVFSIAHTAAIKHKAEKLAPKIAFSAPADESSVSSFVPVRAVSPDVERVKSVTFLVDGVEVSKAAGPGGAFKWDTTKIGDGWHTLTAVAKDANGKTSEADLAVMVHNFVDRSAPSIAITWPTDGNRKGEWITTKVHVADNIGVTSVEAYVDEKLVATSANAPFDMKWKWSKLDKGAHTIVCRAYDAAGNCSTSAPITIQK